MLEERHVQANNMLQERHYQGSMYRNVIRHYKCQARWYTRHARKVTRCFLTALRHPTLKQMVFWTATGVHQLRCTGQWVCIHAETLERFYCATVAHATRCFTTHSLREWRKQIHQQVQVMWECKRDFFEFHGAQCTSHRCMRHASNALHGTMHVVLSLSCLIRSV